MSVGVGTTLTFADALRTLGPPGRDEAYWAGRCTLIHRPDDIAIFDREFYAWWRGLEAEPVRRGSVVQVPVVVAVDGDDAPADEGDEETLEARAMARWSAHETLRHKDFARCSEAELDEAHRLMEAMRFTGAERRSRRRRATRHRVADRHLDVRRTVRLAIGTDGEIVRRRYTAPGTTRRRLVLLLDISGSMEPYARALVRFAHAVVVGRTKVEVFVFGTSLTRLTRELAVRDPDRALTQAAAAVNDWSGGTRLGACLRAFNDQWGVRGTARGATVVILSDGWDRGDPAVLAEQMARLSRVAHRIVWVNPLVATDGYEPTARGMAAALPYVDRFLAGHNVAALDQLLEAIS
jgi:uncharacterized protein with von Willebrand factor type A (vWA) domain